MFFKKSILKDILPKNTYYANFIIEFIFLLIIKKKDYLEVAGSGKLGPINLMVGYFIEVEALYVEAAFLVGAVDIGIGFGSDSKDAFYAGGDSGLVNLSFGGSKEIKITEEYSLPLSGSFIYNPDNEAAFLVFGMNF